ncbi:MAG: hypothetical protein GC146_15980 [Limimaricola sp.]|uniref:hypothetical protein n=1 Tax=Limimaricola sp. TaxID=2211665 RepID=UPI001D28E664|nr:hypothetical protein [Limimaricola sp.]MBI1418715.1 hypothetical protein [Limimaricola sp.]
MRYLKTMALAGLMVACGGMAQAGPTLFAGLDWTIGGNTTLQGVVGLASSSMASSGRVTGAKGAVHFDLLGRGNQPEFRLSAVSGKGEVLGELGVGYSLGTGVFGVLGATGNYFEFGGTASFQGDVQGYFGVNSYGSF